MLELDVLAHWKKQNTFAKSIANRQGREPFVIYEGPPTANGKPGIHHVLTRTYKDLIARYKTMRGYYVARTAGWDEHGLPVEIEVQKQLHLKTKDDIYKYGVAEFNAKCAKATQANIKLWEELTERMGYWLDMENAYRTSDPQYIKRVQGLLVRLFNAGMIYHGYKVVPWACDSETVVSNAEVALGYKEVTCTSLYVKFQLECENTFLLAWTTTPWTLPANMALAVNPDLVYKRYYIDQGNDTGYHVVSLLDMPGCELTGTLLGSDLAKERYHPLFVDSQETLPIHCADFVRGEKTGIVHIAPAFGVDDYALFEAKMAPDEVIRHVDPNGDFNEAAPKFLQGLNLLNDGLTIEDRIEAELGDLVFKKEYYRHEYPHNWRTGRPLIYYLRPSWFFKPNRELMISLNKDSNWYPDHVGAGRFGEWIANDVDWAISRERFWGTPLPFYKGDGEWVTGMPWAPHKPEADEVLSGNRDETLRRTPEVLDCWFDSGAMPFAAFDNYRQADVICEAVDQTRGWFYSLLAIGASYAKISPFKNVVCLGHILDKDGQKMAKTKGNVIDPWAMFDKYGADAVRWYMVKTPVGNSLVFKEEDLRAVATTFINRLLNSFNFYQTYAAIEKLVVQPVSVEMPIDRWIFTRCAQLQIGVTNAYDDYNFSEATELIEKFVDDLSNIWIRANRHRFWNTEGKEIDKVAFFTLHHCLTRVCKMAAPIMPFVTDHLWRQLTGKESIHLEDWNVEATPTIPCTPLVEHMMLAQAIIRAGHKCRDEAKVKVRQALQAVYVPDEMKLGEFADLVCAELNVKEVRYRPRADVGIETTLTEELIAEGLAREFVRLVQNLRKEAKLQVTDRIILLVNYHDDTLKGRLESHRDDIMKKLLAVVWQEASIGKEYLLNQHRVGVEITVAKN